MAQVKNVMTILDDATQHITFHDGTMLSFVVQLNTIKDKIPQCTPQEYRKRKPPEYQKKTDSMMEDLLNACEHLNLAAVEYRKRQCQNKAFYDYMKRGRLCLVDLCRRWQDLCNLPNGQ